MYVQILTDAQAQAQMDFGLFFISILVGGPVLSLIYVYIMEFLYKRFKVRIPIPQAVTMLLISFIIMTVIMAKIVYF